MRLTRTGDSVTVNCPAKVNLFLETHGLRPDGFHEIETVMQAITLYDDLLLSPSMGRGIEFRCSDPRLPGGPENLAYRAAELIDREIGLPKGVFIALEKQIPAGAGLGGGSSDAAGVLCGLNELFGLGLSRVELSGLAAELGSDIAFFVYGGTAHCTGRGEKVAPVETDLTMHYVVYCPRSRVSTAEAYQNLSRLGLTSGEHSATFILDCFAQGDFAAVCENVFNRLDEAAVSLAPEVGEAKRFLARVASQAAFVSGSGAAVYVLLDSAGRAAEVAERMRAEGAVGVFLAQTEALGANLT